MNSYVSLNSSSLSPGKPTITSVVIGESSMPTTAYSYSLVMERKQNGILGVCLYTDDVDLFGLTSEDGDGYFTVEGLTGFEKVID